MSSGSSDASDSNCELRDFLRTRRARLSPQDAGLPPAPGVRRVPGLRREEVARLAGVSVDYYVRLERGRDLNVSDSVLDAVARALRLDPADHAHLRALAHPRSSRRGGVVAPQRLRASLRLMLDRLDNVPALILGRRTDVLAANPLAQALFTDFDALPARERNMARYLFLDPDARIRLTDWEQAARDTIASLHLYVGQHRADPGLRDLIGDLADRSTDFRRWWARHEVAACAYGTRRFRHPLVGGLTLSNESFVPTDDPDLRFHLLTAEPGSPDRRALDLLAGWTTASIPRMSHPRSEAEGVRQGKK
ncbi:helix-turn-helix transcriptional regulator [Streptomyces sp. CRN 30]|uniref:helix-turn-helix domain-containing protein n=1 Tax=Streptomyces sp. CRN 30 TaxID=3075613 RepID=UPI002A837E5F|nr:helix-turn-helix transcriptional regulator [Streptomyces sp. CRN 30]